jgi:hypothetical protein
MKSRRLGFLAVQYALVAFPLAADACGGSNPSNGTAVATPQPIAGDIERTTFDPALGVDLAAMIKRASGMYV